MKNIYVDFQVYDSKDPKRLIILDTSIWAAISDKPTIIEIITPGFTTPVVNYFTQNGVNIFSSYSLGLNCKDCGEENIDLPDGVYEITVKGSPDKFNKKKIYLKSTTIENKLDDILIKYYDNCSDCIETNDDIATILRYKNLIRVAEAFVRKGFKCEAQDIIMKVQKFLKNFNNCRKCPHSKLKI